MSQLDAPFEENQLCVILPAVLPFFLSLVVTTPTEESGNVTVVVQERIIKRNAKCRSTRHIGKVINETSFLIFKTKKMKPEAVMSESPSWPERHLFF